MSIFEMTKTKKENFVPKTLYKFRALQNCTDFERVIDIIENGFYCNDFLGFNDMNEGTYIRSSINSNVTLEEKQNYKICSFSDICALDNELMWGHYANAGKGIVIEIEVSNWDDLEDYLKPIKYTKFQEGFDSIEKILTHKLPVWSYESEWRYLKKDMVTNYADSIGKITKIYFGTPYKKLDNYKDIKEKHKNLQKYHCLKSKLIKYCKDYYKKKNGESIKCVDYEFDKPILRDLREPDFQNIEKLCRRHCADEYSHIY